MPPRSPATHSPVATFGPTAASAIRFAELVKKIGLSPALRRAIRKSSVRKKVRKILLLQYAQAKASKLCAFAITLTYRSNRDLGPGQMSAFMDSLRRYCQRHGCRPIYVWSLERAERFHYHLIVWLPHSFTFKPKQLERWWKHGSTWHQKSRNPPGWGKYISEFSSCEVLPPGVRLFGYGGLDEASKMTLARYLLPLWLRKLLPTGHIARRHPGMGWVDPGTGELYRSPYKWTPYGCVFMGPEPGAG